MGEPKGPDGPQKPGKPKEHKSPWGRSANRGVVGGNIRAKELTGVEGIPTIPREVMSMDATKERAFWEWFNATPPLVRDDKFFKEIAQGDFTHLSYLTTIPDNHQDASFIAITNIKDTISLSGLKVVPVGFVKLMTEKGHQSGISFTSVVNISPEIAEEISAYKGPIDLYNLALPRDRDEAYAILLFLAKHQGELRIKNRKILDEISDLRKRT